MGDSRCHIKGLSLHINNNYARKRGIGKKLLLTIRAMMLEEHVDLVAADFNGAALRRSIGNSRQPTNIIEEAFADTYLPMPPGPTPLWRPGAGPGDWAGVCGFLKPPDSFERWKVRQQGAFSIPHDTLGLRPKGQRCHHEVWLHLAFVNHLGDYEPRERHDQRLLIKERAAPYQPSKERGKSGEDDSDRSLSS